MKSALAYTDHFYIETYTIENEVKLYRKWVQYIDASKVGAIDLLEEVQDPPVFKQGTKISIAFEEKDYKKLVSSLSLYLTYTKSNYKFINKEVFRDLKLGTINYDYYGENWALRLLGNEYQTTYLVIIEGVPYKLDIKVLFKFIQTSNSNLDYLLDKHRPNYISQEENKRRFCLFLNGLERCSFEIKLAIGSIDVSASRESLQYTDKTCIHLYKELYLLFIEFYKFVDMDCLSHPDIFTASRNFSYYPYFFINLFNKELYWKKHKVYFDKPENIFNVDPLYEPKLYKLEQVYNRKENQYTNKLKNRELDRIYINHNRYIICLQDSKYSKYSKYVKYYLEKNIESSDIYKTIALCITEEDFKFLKDWFKECCPILRMSDLVNTYNIDSPPEKAEKLESNVFKSFKLVESVERPRAKDLFQYTKEVTALKEPEYINYFISIEEFDSLNVSRAVNNFCLWSSYVANIFAYFKSKDLQGDIFICEKETRNYKHKNWVNLISIILEDCNKFNIDTKTFKGTHLNQIGLHLFRYGFIKNHLPLFYLFKKSDLDDNSYYSYIQNLYIESQQYLFNNTILQNLTNLVDVEIYYMTQMLNKKYISKDFKVPEYIEKSCKEFFDMCEDYQSKLPFLQTYNFNFYQDNFNISDKDYLNYINIMERELGLYIVKNSDEDNANVTLSEFGLLCAKLTSC